MTAGPYTLFQSPEISETLQLTLYHDSVDCSVIGRFHHQNLASNLIVGLSFQCSQRRKRTDSTTHHLHEKLGQL